MRQKITLREVDLRDGLQIHSTFMQTRDKLAWIVAEAGSQEIVIADTVGYADPNQVRIVFKAVLAEVGSLPVAAHFHNPLGIGLANVYAALDCGITIFDASLAGLGGCPFAPGASDNIVMEDLCFMLDSMGCETGVDLQKLLQVRDLVFQALPDIPMQGALARAGLPRGYVIASARMAS
jgi:hydroxymethylglutaryl-CoA lyase